MKGAGFTPRSRQSAGDKPGRGWKVSLLTAPDCRLARERTHQRLSEEASLEQDLKKMKGNLASLDHLSMLGARDAVGQRSP